MRTPRTVIAKIQNQQEKNMSIQELLDKAPRHAPAKEIVALLRENKNAWFSMTVGKGNEYLPIGDFSQEIIDVTGGNTKDVLFCLIILKKSEVVLFEKLREMADFFEFSSVIEEHLHVVLFFLEK